MNRSLLLIALLTLAATPLSSRAANSFDGCTAFITSLPATIATQGTWCLGGDLSTNLTSGAAITIATNNVTVDCNGFKLGGLAAGPGTFAAGIRAEGRQNVTVRGCGIRGFAAGVLIEGAAAGHLVEDNRLDQNRFAGIVVQGDGSVIRRNRVYDTGAGVMPNFSAGILAAGGSSEIRDNIVFGVEATPGAGSDAWGIAAQGLFFGRIAGNSVRFVAGDTGGTAYGIDNQLGTYVTIDDNHVATIGAESVGIACDAAGTLVRDNFIQGFGTGVGALCEDEGRNAYYLAP